MRLSQSLSAVAAGVVTIAILSGMLVAHAWPLWTGEPIYLAVRPVDPRDLFRGDYVTLGYDIQRVRLRVPPEVAPTGPLPPTAPGAGAMPAPVEVDPVGAWWQPHATGRGVFGRDRVRALFLQLRPEPSDIPGVPARYVPVSLSDEPAPGAINLAGRLQYYSHPAQIAGLDFGIDALFVQEGTGRPIEDAIRRRVPVYAEVFVTRSGTARVRGLIIDGQPTAR